MLMGTLDLVLGVYTSISSLPREKDLRCSNYYMCFIAGSGFIFYWLARYIPSYTLFFIITLLIVYYYNI